MPQRHYPAGYRVQVAGASIASPPGAGTLRLCNLPGAGRVSVVVTPDSGGSTALPDPFSSSSCPASAASPASGTSVAGDIPLTISANGAKVSLPGLITLRLPPAGRCLSHRRFTVHLSLRTGARVIGGFLTVAGRRVKLRRGRRVQATVNLRGLPRGRFHVRLVVRLRRPGGRAATIRLARRYRTCVPGRAR
jgi:hypothetical protein